MAISKITTKAITDGTIATADLADNAVNSAKIGADVIVAEDVANNAITVNEIQNGAVTSAKLDTNIAVSGTLGVTGALTAGSLAADGGVTIDNITIDGTEIDLSSGSLTVDSAGSITLDCGNGELLFNNAGNGNLLKVQGDSSNVNLISMVQDKDIRFQGNDGGSTITAMTIDMSEGGMVGIGTTSPIAKLHTQSGSSGRSWSSGVDRVIHEANSTNIMQIVSNTTGTAGINFADTDARAVSGVEYNHNTKDMSISLNEGAGTIKFFNTTERMRIDSSGRVGIGITPTVQFQVEESSTGDAVKIARGANYILLGGSGSGTQYVKGYEATVAFGNKYTGNTTFLTGDTERMRIDSSGNVGINNTSPSANLDITANVNAGFIAEFHQAHSSGYGLQVAVTGSSLIFFYKGGANIGNIVESGGGVNYGSSSDYRLKENVTYDFDATTRLKQLKPSRFNFKTDPNTTLDGFLAHEVSAIVPEAITGEKDAVDSDGNIIAQNIDQSKLVPLLVKTIQELEARITALESA